MPLATALRVIRRRSQRCYTSLRLGALGSVAAKRPIVLPLICSVSLIAKRSKFSRTTPHRCERMEKLFAKPLPAKELRARRGHNARLVR